MAEELVTDDMRESLRESFKVLKNHVDLHVFTKKGSNDQFNELTINVIKEVAKVHPKIEAHFHTVGDEASKKYGVERSPTVLVSPERYNIRFTGSPLGEEGRSLVMAIVMASTGQTLLSDDSRSRLDSLKEKRHVRVFVSPTCPYCPQQFLYAVSAAVEKPDFVSAEATEIYENRDLAEKFSAMSVPKTFVNDVLTSPGLEPEEYFVGSVVEGKRVEYVIPTEVEEIKDYDVIIIGGGPAGLTAAIYAGRSGLKSVIFDRANVGGQVTITPVVENYPGFTRIQGKALVDMISQQATQYAPVVQGMGVEDIKRTSEGFEVSTKKGTYTAKAIIISTGAAYRTLDVPGESEFRGRGVSYCATCDGYIFKDGKTVVVVGGGNTALTDALYLDSIGAHVSIVHRRDKFRAEERLQKSLSQRNIPVHWNSRVTEITGEKVVEGVKVQDLETGETKTLKVDGVFIDIGYRPSNEIAAKLGLELDEMGYVKADRAQRTSQPYVYAAGDITGGEKQIAVATGQGSIAAISAFEDLSNPYWKKAETPPQ
jgi:thioredoxin reductase (NADPH)